MHRSYLNPVAPLLDDDLVHALSHITGGGIIGNTKRVLPEDCALDIEWDAWPRPKLFSMIQELGKVPEEDMRRTFNLGIGLIVITSEANSAEVIKRLSEEQPVVIGRVVAKD